MEIACPQCSMQYALDPSLLPAGGVPVQCSRCRHVFIAAPPEPAAPSRPAPAPNLSSTMLYGANKAGTPPSASGTQVFGAVPQVPSVAPMAPAAPRPQPAPSGLPPSAMTTQLFGAVPQVPQVAPMAPVAPAAPRPQPAPSGLPPSASSTQVFGAVPQVPPVAPAANKPPPAAQRPPAAASKPPAGATPTPQATQVFGAVPQPSPAAGQPPQGHKSPTPSPQPEPPAGPRPQPTRRVTPPPGSVPQQTAPGARPPAGATPAPQATQVFGAVPQPAAPAPTGVTSQPPGLSPRTPAPEPLPATPATPEPPVMGVAATTPIELPDEILDQLNRPLSELMAEDAARNESQPAAGPSGPGLSKPLELPSELLDGTVDVNKGRGDKSPPPPSHKGRNLLIVAGVLVLGLTAFLTSPAWLSRTHTVPHEIRVAQEEAVAMLRRDDATSKEDALSRLKALSATHPQSVDLRAEVGIALAMHLDDTQVRVTTLKAREKRLQSRISALLQSETPADWRARVSTMREELTTTQRELTPLEERAAALSKEAVQVLKQLESAPEKEEQADALARMRARALMNAALGGGDALTLAVKLAQADLRDWSTLVMAEYVLNYPTPSDTQIQEAFSALERMREKDKTFLRTYVLGARIALMRKEPAVAQPLLETVITLNPKHELARLLQGYARALENPDPEPAPAPENEPAPENTPAPGPEATAPTTPAPEASPTP